jgi:hypothetical protein
VVAQWFPQQLDTTKILSFMPSFELATLVMGGNMMSYFVSIMDLIGWTAFTNRQRKPVKQSEL